MENQKRMLNNEYISGFLHKNTYNNNNIILKSSPNNDSRVTPAYSGNPLLYANKNNIYPLNYPNTIKRTSTNIYELSIPRIRSNNPQNIISSKYKVSTLTSNSFSPLAPNISHLSSISKYNNNQNFNRNNSSPYLNIKRPKKTLILDLDETLVHSGFNPFTRKSDINLIINIEGRDHVINVLKRPHLDEFLKEISEYYEIIVFTASVSEYASPLLDKLDKNNYLSGRLFRQDCLFNQGLYIKDIKIIGKHLKDMIIIDNNPISYADNEDNGIPILTWYDDLNDNELIKLIPLLKYLSTVNDVRPIIRQIVNRQTNEVDFHIVSKIINNKIYENEMVNNNLYNQNNLNYRLNGSKYNDENRSSNIIDNKYRNYLDAYNANEYNNNNLNSFSNMTLSEIKNERITSNNINNYYQRNIEKNEQDYNYKNYNENILKKNNYENIVRENREIPSEENQNSLLCKYNVDNIRYKKMEIDNIKSLSNNNKSILDRINSPNRNLERGNLYFNNNPNINSYNNPNNIEEKNYKKINNYQVKESIYRFSNNFNNKSSIDIFSSDKNNNDIKEVKDNNNINNNPIKTSENKIRGISDYYLQSYKKHLLRRPRSNSFNYRNVNRTNIENDENNNPNYIMNSRNDNNNSVNDINKKNSILNYDRNNIIEYRISNNSNKYTNYLNLNKSGTNDNESNGNTFINEENNKSINYHINEKKLNYIYNENPKEENNDKIDNNDNNKYYTKIIKPNSEENNINRSNENYRDFLRNYLRNTNNKNENEFNNITSNKNNKEIYKRNSLKLIKEKDNNLNKSFSTENNNFLNNFSSNKNYEHRKYNYNYSLNYISNEQSNGNNLRNSILKNDFERSYYNNNIIDNETFTNKSNIIGEEKTNNNYESFILSQKKENIDNNINNIYTKINNFILNNIKKKQNVRYNPSEKYKKYLIEINRKGERNFPISNNKNKYSFFKNHNDIDSYKGPIRSNFNNYIIKLRNNNLNNISNISHQVNFMKDRQKEIDIDKSIESIKRMNKSYSYFHPKIKNNFLGNGTENKFFRNKNIDKNNQYKYYYRNNNNQSNDIDRKKLIKDNSLNRFSYSRIRNKFLNDYYKNNNQ